MVAKCRQPELERGNPGNNTVTPRIVKVMAHELGALPHAHSHESPFYRKGGMDVQSDVKMAYFDLYNDFHRHNNSYLMFFCAFYCDIILSDMKCSTRSNACVMSNSAFQNGAL